MLGSGLILFFGNEGYYEYLELAKHKDTLKMNIAELKSINKSLLEKLYLLSSNPEVLRILARELGYFEENENIIVFDKDFENRYFYEVGKLIQSVKKSGERNFILRVSGLAFGTLFFLVIFYLYHIRKKLNANKSRK